MYIYCMCVLGSVKCSGGGVRTDVQEFQRVQLASAIHLIDGSNATEWGGQVCKQCCAQAKDNHRQRVPQGRHTGTTQNAHAASLQTSALIDNPKAESCWSMAAKDRNGLFEVVSPACPTYVL